MRTPGLLVACISTRACVVVTPLSWLSSAFFNSSGYSRRPSRRWTWRSLSRYSPATCAVVQKWGNSLALRIPRPFAGEVGLREDSEVELRIVDGTLVVRPARKFSLAGLLAGVTRRNLHGEVRTGGPVGNESW
ncbi:MAG: AbrB/MazE/SpoVT family DNA-binding domain-containing protein [Actinomycetota bacterium]